MAFGDSSVSFQRVLRSNRRWDITSFRIASLLNFPIEVTGNGFPHLINSFGTLNLQRIKEDYGQQNAREMSFSSQKHIKERSGVSSYPVKLHFMQCSRRIALDRCCLIFPRRSSWLVSYHCQSSSNWTQATVFSVKRESGMPITTQRLTPGCCNRILSTYSTKTARV